jgi:hypothetical protein
MHEKVLQGYPDCFVSPDVLVGESANSHVVGYEAQKVVAKVRKPENWRVFTSKKQAKDAIKERREQANTIRRQLAQLGTSPDRIPNTASVVHASREGSVTFTEVQPWYQGSSTLAESPSRLISLPQRTLQDLRNLFAVSVNHFLHTGETLDINGSFNRSDGLVKKTAQSLFPIFNASNVLIDADEQMVYVDHGVMKPNYSTIPAHIRHRLDVVGSVISVGILDSVMAIKRRFRN